MTFKFKRISMAAVLVLLLPLFSVQASAEAPASGEGIKGSLTAWSTDLDKSAYADGSRYENEPPQVETVKIGLAYEDSSVWEASFTNTSGGGFQIGVYGEDRAFIPLAETRESEILITGTAGMRWHILLDGEFDTQAQAADLASFYGGFTRIIGGKYRALYGSYGSRDAAENDLTDNLLPGVLYSPDDPCLQIQTARGETLFSIGQEQRSIALLPAGESMTGYGGDIYRGGFKCLLGEDGRLTVINYVNLEDYVKGVLPYEMSQGWPYEALRAQAVCARTYVVYHLDEYSDQGFDITADTYSQVYRGVLEADESTDLAVDSTAGQYVRYKGQICQIYYFAADGGATEDGKNVFEADKPYLTGKPDPFEEALNFSLKTWSEKKSGEYLSARLALDGYDLGPVLEVRPEYSDTGNVIAMTFADGDGNSVRIEGRRCYTILRLNSPRFTVTGGDGEDFLFTGGGLGHSCGMSQWGAYAMAAVYGYDYEDIIRFYFTGVYIA